MKLTKLLASISLIGIVDISCSFITSCQKNQEKMIEVNKYHSFGPQCLYSQPLFFQKDKIYTAAIDLSQIQDFSSTDYSRWDFLICYVNEKTYDRQQNVNIIEENAKLTFNNEDILLSEQTDRFTLIKDTSLPPYYLYGVEATPYDQNTTIKIQFEVEKDTDMELCAVFIPREPLNI